MSLSKKRQREDERSRTNGRESDGEDSCLWMKMVREDERREEAPMETVGKGNGGKGEKKRKIKWRGKREKKNVGEGAEEDEAGRRTGEDGKGLKEVKEHGIFW